MLLWNTYQLFQPTLDRRDQTTVPGLAGPCLDWEKGWKPVACPAHKLTMPPPSCCLQEKQVSMSNYCVKFLKVIFQEIVVTFHDVFQNMLEKTMQ